MYQKAVTKDEYPRQDFWGSLLQFNSVFTLIKKLDRHLDQMSIFDTFSEFKWKSKFLTACLTKFECCFYLLFLLELWKIVKKCSLDKAAVQIFF